MSDPKQQQQQDALTEARELFLEAELDQALTKFKEAAAAAAGDKKRWPESLAAETGQAEVRIQQKDWNGAADLLTAAVTAADAAAGLGGDAASEEEGAIDLTRARYMLGIALLGKRKTAEAKVEFETAQRLAEASPELCRGLLPDIQDRLAQMDEEVEEDDLTEIAMEFGVTPEEDEEDEEEDEDEDYEGEDDEEAAIANSRKRRAAAVAAAAANRANGGGEDDDDEDDLDDEEEDDEEEEEEDYEAVPEKRARVAAATAGIPRNGRGKTAAKDQEEDEEEEDEEEVSSSA